MTPRKRAERFLRDLAYYKRKEDLYFDMSGEEESYLIDKKTDQVIAVLHGDLEVTWMTD